MKSNARWIALLGISVLVLAACGGSDGDGPTQAEPPDASAGVTASRFEELAKSAQACTPAIAALDQYFSRLVKDNEPGLTVVVVRKGRVVHFGGYGYADVENKRKFSPGTAMHIASTGKQFTALAILALVQMRRVDLDAPASRYVPEVMGLDAGVTVRRLLNHTAGVGTYYPGEDENRGWNALLGLVESEKTGVPNGAQAARVLASLPLRFPPGTSWEYSNAGYELLGTIVERASGSSYQSFVEDAVFRPLGMTQSFLLPSDRQSRPNVAASYVASNGIDQRELKRVDREGVLELRYLDALPGAGTAYVTPIDMVKYDAAWREGFPELQSTLVAQMLQPTGPAQQFAYGLGVFVGFPEITEPALRQQLARLGPKVMTHPGGWPAFYTQFARFESKDVTVFVTFNRDYLRDDAGAIRNLTPDEQRQLSDEMIGTSFTKMLADVAETALVGKSVFACGRF